MAWSDGSSWSSTKNVYDTKATDSTGLTDKQKDMSTARNPMNYNIQNKVLPQTEKAPPKTEKPIPQAQDTNRQKENLEEVNRMRSNIGSSAYKVQGLVNKFLTQGQATADVKMGTETVFEGGKNVTKNVLPKDLDISGAVAEKTGQLEAIKSAAAPFYKQDPTGRWKSKSMEEYVKGQDSYATLPPEKQSQIDQLMGIASTINEYEQRGQGKSAEALALRDQLQGMDRGGLVSGMYKAIEDYKKFSSKDGGMEWTGDEGEEGYNLEEILNLDSKKISDEIKSALVASSGLFGGDYESNLKRMVDLESDEYKKAQQEDLEYRNSLLDASEGYFAEHQKTLQGNADKIKAAFDSAIPSILAQMGGENTPAAKMAVQFLTKLQGSNPKDFTTLISDLLYNKENGLAPEQRKQLSKMIGAFTGDTKGGQIQSWINELATTGKVSVNGQDVELNSEQKYEILTALRKGDSEAVDKLITNAFGVTEMGNMIKQAEDLSGPGNVQEQVNVFAKSLVDSMATFAGSKTEDAVRLSLGLDEDKWNAMSQKDKTDLMADTLSKNPGLLFSTVEGTYSEKQKQLQETAKVTKEKIPQYFEKLNLQKESVAKAIANVQSMKAHLPTVAATYIHNAHMNIFNKSAPKYAEYFAKNAAAYKSMGYDSSATLNAQNALAYRDVFLKIKESQPELYQVMAGSNPDITRFLESDSRTAITMALSGKNVLDATYNTLKSFINNDNEILTKNLSRVPLFRNRLDALAGFESKLNTNLGIIGQNITDLEAKDKSLDAIIKGTANLFSPEYVLQETLNMGKSLTGGKVDFGKGDALSTSGLAKTASEAEAAGTSMTPSEVGQAGWDGAYTDLPVGESTAIGEQDFQRDVRGEGAPVTPQYSTNPATGQLVPLPYADITGQNRSVGDIASEAAAPWMQYVPNKPAIDYTTSTTPPSVNTDSTSAVPTYGSSNYNPMAEAANIKTGPIPTDFSGILPKNHPFTPPVKEEPTHPPTESDVNRPAPFTPNMSAFSGLPAAPTQQEIAAANQSKWGPDIEARIAGMSEIERIIAYLRGEIPHT